MKGRCEVCGDPFERNINGYIFDVCPNCFKRYLKGERGLKEKIKTEREQKRLI
jgi:ribosome-binding protein aMBF1 (putative translation factor)